MSRREGRDESEAFGAASKVSSYELLADTAIRRDNPVPLSASLLFMTGRAWLIALTCLVCAGAAQADETARTVTVAPGARYEAGWLYRFFLGEHWRDAWTTPIE